MNEIQISNGGHQPISLSDAMQLAEILASSTIIPKDYQRNPGNILTAVLMGAELGLAPLQAMQNIATINGRPSIWGDAMLGLVKNSPEFVSIKEEYVGEADDLTAVCTVKRRSTDGSIHEHVATFSMEDARKAGLLGKQGPWTQYPKRMLQMRARGYALRDMFPDVLKGLRTTEEVRDMPPEKDMGEVEEVAEKETKSVRERVLAHLNKTKSQAKEQQAPADSKPSPAELLIIKLDSVETTEQLKPLYDECKEFATDELAPEIKKAYQNALARIRAEDAEMVESSN
ncbi:recombinase RecT [Oligella urethralis]|uniref:recombinase RecT n=1 Tax=Oligella urethralis TaxID=90245 RepID=UPI00288A894F|nr:recombinase RecT [Oligella urethralis]